MEAVVTVTSPSLDWLRFEIWSFGWLHMCDSVIVCEVDDQLTLCGSVASYLLLFCFIFILSYFHQAQCNLPTPKKFHCFLFSLFIKLLRPFEKVPYFYPTNTTISKPLAWHISSLYYSRIILDFFPLTGFVSYWIQKCRWGSPAMFQPLQTPDHIFAGT